MDRADLLSLLARTFAGREDVDVALLFGSRARGAAGDGADVDVAILGAADPLDVSARIHLATGCEVDVVDLRRAGVPLLERILRDGVVFHERVPHAAATWRSGALAMLELDRPWYARMRDATLRRLARVEAPAGDE